MIINLPDEFIERAKEHIRKNELYATVEAFIKDAVTEWIENYPWCHGDICVHFDECMHRKSVEDWKKEK